MLYDLKRVLLIDRSSILDTRHGTWFPVSLHQIQGRESADAADAADAAAADSASAEPVSVWSDGLHPGPTNCAVSYTHTENRQQPIQPDKILSSTITANYRDLESCFNNS